MLTYREHIHICCEGIVIKAELGYMSYFILKDGRKIKRHVLINSDIYC